LRSLHGFSKGFTFLGYAQIDVSEASACCWKGIARMAVFICPLLLSETDPTKPPRMPLSFL